MNKRDIGRKASALAFSLVMVFAIFASVPSAMAASEKTYTLDADFDLGTLVGVEHETVHDQLQLSKEQTTLPFIWVPNSPQGTVSKVDTVTGNELGRYMVAPPGVSNSNGNPSRTTVDLKGNVWVGNREAGTVVKIGLSENGQCVDRNIDGDIDTSTDANNDGDITGGELLAWGTDECVLYEVVLIPGSEGTYVPGTYAGSYDTNYWGTAPRGLAIDKDNNLWAGTSTTYRMFYINGETGAILKNIGVSAWGNGAYGAVIDGDGKVWIAVLSYGVRKFDPSTDTITQVIPLSHTYGLGLDYEGNLLVGGSGLISKITTSTGAVQWTKGAQASQGITATSDNNIWVASNTEHRYDKDGNWIASIPGFSTSITGVAVDAAGKVWGTEYSDWIRRVNPATNTVDLSKQLIGSGSHYSYSDMTGIMARTVTTKIGTWKVDFDSEVANTPWGTVSWNSAVPSQTSVKVQVRSSNDKLSWSDWEIAANGVKLTATPAGRYLQVETTLQSDADDLSPILYDLTVKVGNQPPVAEAGDSQIVNEGSPVTLSGLGSTDPDGDSLTYEWDLGDGIFTPSATGIETITPTDGLTILNVVLRVSDGKGGISTDSTTVTVVNVAPVVDAGPDANIDEGDTFSSSGSFTDPGTDTWTATVDYGDGSGVQPLSLSGKTFALSHLYADNCVCTVTVTVDDGDGGVGTDTAIVTVNNVAPAVTIAESYYATIPVTLRIAGQGKVGNSVALEIIQDGNVLASDKIIRTPSSPNEQEVTISANIDLSKPYSGRLIFDTEVAYSGGTPVWVIIDGVKTKVTTFNTQKSDTASYHQAYDFALSGLVSLIGKEISFTGSATDPGTDDMTFAWLFGDGGLASQLYPWPNGHFVTETVKHTYSAAGSYTLQLDVTDDDLGVGSATKAIEINAIVI